MAKRDLRTLIAAVNDERLAFLKGLKTWPVFGAGWARRVAEVRAAALRMADVAPKDKVPSTSAQKTTAGTIAVAGAAAAQQAHSAGAEPEIIADRRRHRARARRLVRLAIANGRKTIDRKSTMSTFDDLRARALEIRRQADMNGTILPAR